MHMVYVLIKDLIDMSVENAKKSDFHEQLSLLNTMVCKELGDITIDNSRFSNVFFKSPEYKLFELEQKLQDMENGAAVLPEAVLLGEDKIRMFLKKYNIGFLSEIHLNQYGKFFVKIPCMISKHSSFHNRDHSKNLEYKIQMETLDKLGLDLAPCKVSNNNTPAILATQNSIDILNELIEKTLGGIGTHMQINVFKGQKTIREITFRIDPETLFAYNDVQEEINCDVTETLNPDEVILLKHELKELASTFDSYNDDFLKAAKDSCRSIIIHTFANICRTVGLENEITKEVEKAYKKTREINEQIHKKENEIKAKINPATIKKNINKVMYGLEKLAIDKLGFNCLDLQIFSHSTSIDFHYNPTNSFGVYCNDVNGVSEEYLKKTFEMTNGCFDDETLLIVNTPKNIEILNNLISSTFAQAYVAGVEIEKKRELGYCIKKISIDIPQLNVF